MGHFSYLSYEIINLRALVSISQTIWNVLPNCGQSQASVCLWSFALAILSTWHTWPMQCLATDLCFSLALRAAFFDLYWRSPLPHPGYFLSHYPALLSPYHLSPVEIIFFKKDTIQAWTCHAIGKPSANLSSLVPLYCSIPWDIKMIKGVEYITVIQDIRGFPIQNHTWSLGEDGYQGGDLANGAHQWRTVSLWSSSTRRPRTSRASEWGTQQEGRQEGEQNTDCDLGYPRILETEWLTNPASLRMSEMMKGIMRVHSVSTNKG